MQKIFFFLACFFICADCFSQQYPFVFYTPKNGLVNSRVRKMYQDNKGRLYFLTYGGMSVYDGPRFRNYTTHEGLASDMINDIVQLGKDSFLIAPNAAQLNLLAGGQIKSFQPDTSFCPIVNQFLKSSDGRIYMATDQGFFLLQGKKFEHLPFDMPGGIDTGLFLGDMTDIGGMILIGTNDLRGHIGLYLYDKKNKRLADALLHLPVSTFAKDHTDHVWISNRAGTFELDSSLLKKGKLELISLPGSYQQASDLNVSSFAFDEANTWMIYNGKEIMRLGNNGSSLHIKIPDENGQGNSNRIFIDKENITWIYSMGGGAFKLVNTSLQINDPIPGNSKGDIISDVSYSTDTTWFAINPNRAVRKTHAGVQVFTVNIPATLYAIRQVNNRLILFDEKNIYQAAIPSAASTKINVTHMLSLPDSSFGGLCITDPYGNNILTEHLHVTVVQAGHIIFRYPIAESDLVQGLQFDSQHRLWITSRFQGIKIFSVHPENPSQYLQLIGDFHTVLGNASPRSFVLDKNDRVWVGTRDNGLFALDYKNNQLKIVQHLHTRSGLTDNFITSLSCDSSNNIIVGTQTGLDRLVPTGDEYRIENITKSNAVFGYISTTWVDRQNQAYGLMNSLSLLQVTAATVSSNTYTPQLFIEDIKINGIAVSPSGSAMRLPYSQRNISFNVAAPAFADEQQVKYSYLLEGSGTHEWSEASANASINFLNLPPGKYTLQVKAFFPSTAYPTQQLSYPFVIVPPWWQTIWFRILAGILFIGLVIVIIRFYYTRKLTRQRTILERQQAVEKERTRIATDMHDDLGAGLSRIKFLSETIGIKKQQQEPIEEDISKIREYSHDMIDKMGEIVWALNKDNDTLSDLLGYTRAYAAEYLSQNGIQCMVEAPDQFPTLYVSGEFRRNIYLTVKEALHNIIKHSQASRADIHIITGKDLTISIHDDGVGFDEKKIRPYSNGLTNMKKRMNSLNGELTILNEKGTTVTLKVPLP